MAVLAKAARNDGGAQDDERNQRYRHDGGEPNEVFYVLEQVHLPAPDLGRESARKIAQ